MYRYLVIFSFIAHLHAAGVFVAIPQAPDFSLMKEYMHQRVDFGIRTVPIPQIVFQRVLQTGEFINANPQVAYSNPDHPYEPKLGRYKGAFSLSDGSLFVWSLLRRQIIEIKDAQHRTAWVITSEDFLSQLQKAQD